MLLGAPLSAICSPPLKALLATSMPVLSPYHRGGLRFGP
jgi:hypothetical protein